MKTSMKRRRSRKKIYAGWGTEELIEFLSGCGKDTKDALDEADVVGVVKEYIKQKDLFLGDKKKHFQCDDKLRPLFTRRKVKYNMLHSKLRMHLAANADSEDEDDDGSEGDTGPLVRKKLKTNLELKIAEKVSERNKRCFASLNQHNISTLYLRRSLVVTLLSNMDTFEKKVVGCFVRVRYHDLSYFSRNVAKPFQLGLVTGIKESKEKYKVNNTCTNVYLCIAGFWDDVEISKLSDEDIGEDEYNDLIALVEKGYMKRATVGELEEKVAAVHTDIVNNWIDKELRRLEGEIVRAHENGWHKELCELLDQKKLLSTPAEKQRRLAMVPEITADAEEEKESEGRIEAVNPCLGNTEATQLVADSLDVLEVEPTKEATQLVADSIDVLKAKPSEEAPQLVADSVDILKVEPPKGVADYAAESFQVQKEKPPEELSKAYADGSKTQGIDVGKDESNHSKRNEGGNIPVHEVISLKTSDLEEDLHAPERETMHPSGAMTGAVNALNIPNEESSKGAADEIADSLEVHDEELPEGATEKMAGSYPLSLLNEEPSEAASKQGDATCEVASEAGEALSSGLTPDSMLHSPLHKAQDGSKTEAIDIVKDESNQSKHNEGGNVPVLEVISLKTSDHEDLHAPERETMHPPGAMNGGNLQVERAKSASHGQGSMNGVHLGQCELAPATVNGMLSQTPMWHYEDPQGDSHGPFQLIELWSWKIGGFFDESFKVWRTGQTKEHAISLTDAFRMNL